jgi:hypothetical protein
VEDSLLGSFIADVNIPRFSLPLGNHGLKFNFKHESGLVKRVMTPTGLLSQEGCGSVYVPGS